MKNQLESTLHHNLEVSIKNAMSVLMYPMLYTEKQRLDAWSELGKRRVELMFVDSYDDPSIVKPLLEEIDPQQAINHNHSNSIPEEQVFSDEEGDVHGFSMGYRA